MSEDLKDKVAWGDCLPKTPIDWFQGRMRASGITEAVAEMCGIRMGVDDTGAYFRLPFYTVDAVPVMFEKLRYRTLEEGGGSRPWDGPKQSSGVPGKYQQKKGSKSRVYWPPNSGSQRVPYNHPKFPLLVCEGELKSIAARMAVMASSLPVLVCGVPGTKLQESVLKELQDIVCMFPASPGTPSEHRTVYLAMDWNEKGAVRERGLQVEAQLRRLFQELGATVHLLRWEIEDGAGPQKLDEWLTAGGDIGAALRHTEDEAERQGSELQALWDYYNEHYALMDARYIPLRNPRLRYSRSDFNTMEEHRGYVPMGAKKAWTPAETWGKLPMEQRNMVHDVVFLPAPLGKEPEQYVWDKGRRLLNLAPKGWIDDRAPWDLGGVPDIAPFLRLLERLCGEHVGWFMDYLAHIAQRPTDRGQHIVIFRDEGSTGKSALFKTLDKVFGDYSSQITLDGSFNSILEGLLIAYASDLETKPGLDRHLETTLKNFSGEDTLLIKRKYVAEYVIKNYARMFIATNKDYVVPFGPEERRYVVFGGTEKLLAPEWTAYADWLDAGGVDALRYHLIDRDISSFDYRVAGPRTQQREDMEKASAPELDDMLTADHGPFAARDIWTADQIAMIYNNTPGVRARTPKSVGMVLAKLKCEKRKVNVTTLNGVLWALRGEWENRTNAEWLKGWEGKF